MEDRTEKPDSGEDTGLMMKRKPLGFLSQNVDLSLTSVPIILCCFCSGLIDSCVFNAWGVFATMQTGMKTYFERSSL